MVAREEFDRSNRCFAQAKREAEHNLWFPFAVLLRLEATFHDLNKGGNVIHVSRAWIVRNPAIHPGYDLIAMRAQELWLRSFLD